MPFAVVDPVGVLIPKPGRLLQQVVGPALGVLPKRLPERVRTITRPGAASTAVAPRSATAAGRLPPLGRSRRLAFSRAFDFAWVFDLALAARLALLFFPIRAR